jgi:hypothetical protein
VPEPALEELRQEVEPDVHADEEVEGMFTCRDCPQGNQFALIPAAEMLEHVLEHRARGAQVLDETLDALRDATARG